VQNKKYNKQNPWRTDWNSPPDEAAPADLPPPPWRQPRAPFLSQFFSVCRSVCQHRAAIICRSIFMKFVMDFALGDETVKQLLL